MTAISKRGFCIPWNFPADQFAIYSDAINSGAISWIYNWEMWKPQGIPSNVLFIPQCRTGQNVEDIAKYIPSWQDDEKTQDFLGFNEPDIKFQAHMSASQGVELWKQYILPIKQAYPSAKVGSPAVSNGPNGIQWLKDFFDAIGGTENAGVDHIVVSLPYLHDQACSTIITIIGDFRSLQHRFTGTESTLKSLNDMFKKCMKSSRNPFG
jgi:hypothetical protein